VIAALLLLAAGLTAEEQQDLRYELFNPLIHPLTHVACDLPERQETIREIERDYARLRKRYLADGGAPRTDNDLAIANETQHYHCSPAKTQFERDQAWQETLDSAMHEYDDTVRLFRRWKKEGH
jgi:hypothetical protein